MEEKIVVENRDFAFQKRLCSISLVNQSHTDLNEFFDDAFKYFETNINPLIEEHTIIKIASCFVGSFVKNIVDEEGELREEKQTMYIHTRFEIIDFETNLDEFYNEYIVTFLTNKIDDFELRGSGFTLSEIMELNLQVSEFNPLAGSSYIDLPLKLRSKKAIINVKNQNNECFKYAILSALYPGANNPQRPQAYDKIDHNLNFTSIRFPTSLKDLSKFENQNVNISINVYMYDSEKELVRPLRLTKEVKTNHIHLLMLTMEPPDAMDEVKTHYCWIKNLSALIGKQTSSNCSKKFFCDRCLNHFKSSEQLNMHMINCSQQNSCQIEMPDSNENILKFTSVHKQLPVPFIVYADVESLLKEPDKPFCKSDKTTAFQEHEAFSIVYYFKSWNDDSQSYYRSYRGPDCIDWFVKEMREMANNIEEILDDKQPLNMSTEDEKRFNESTHCHICGNEYLDSEKRVRDHSHITGKFRGSAHSECNILYRETRNVPVVFHNLSNYDAHFIIKKIAANEKGSISIVPTNDELYISFTKVFPSNNTNDFKQFIKFRFIDSFRFMASALDNLASLLPSNKKKNLYKHFKDNWNDDQIQLLQRKGVFCYDYMDSWCKLDEEALPTKEQFYSKLTEKHITDDEYQHARNVWSTFNTKTLGEYSDLYMKTDILLLSDIFENFRETCIRIYDLDPAHYYTAPGLSFDAMLKYTKVNIELLTDVDMLLFVERGIRGGISQCSKRYSKANNKYMEDFDPNLESQYLMYLDANNLYGYSMMQHLPHRKFEWGEKETFTAENILKIPDDADTGYIFEVDLEYPKHLHNKHKDYPMCPEHQSVPGTKNDKKLLLTLYDKKNYVIHYTMLKLALQQGLILKRIHRVLKFEQSQWLKPYVELNTQLRTQATNDFEKNFFKLLINAIYGKTMENIRSRKDIKLKSKWEGRFGARKLIAQAHFKRYTIFDENLVAIHMNKIHMKMNKPIAVGMAILDISKVLMYDFYYNFLQPQYDDKIQMMYTDTDSFIFEVKTDCFYSDMKKTIHKYDTSDFQQQNVYNMPRLHKKIPGLFKDELNGQIFTEFVGLRSKMYAVKCGSIDKMKKAKGVKKYVLSKNISFDDYIKCVRNNGSVVREQNSFRSKKHCVFSIRQQKIALCSLDNKRCILENNIDTLPWGHYNIPE